MTDYLEHVVIADIRSVYGELFLEEETILAAVLEQIYVRTKRKFIILVDEWDCVMRERQESEALQKQYLDFLRDLLKDQPYVALAYMTGICLRSSSTSITQSLWWRRCSVRTFPITARPLRSMMR